MKFFPLLFIFLVLFSIHAEGKPFEIKGDLAYFKGTKTLYTGSGTVKLKNGKVKTFFNYLEGHKEGSQKIYYRNGTLARKTNFQKGFYHGLNEAFFPNGKAKYREVYGAGLLKRRERWDDSGKPLFASHFGHQMLWEGTTGSSTLSILGSIHYFNKEYYPLPRENLSRFKKAQILIMEIPFSEKTLEEINQETQKVLGLPLGVSLQDLISSTTFQNLSTYFSENNLSVEFFLKTSPLLLSQVIVQIELKKLEMEFEEGLDLFFYKNWKNGTPIVGLETVEEQITLLKMETWPKEYPEQSIQLALEPTQPLGEFVDILMETWHQGDHKILMETMLKGLKEGVRGNEYKIIFANRNKIMSQRLMEIIKVPGDYFIVVGSGHLVGPKNIIEILGDNGIHLTQLKKLPKTEP